MAFHVLCADSMDVFRSSGSAIEDSDKQMKMIKIASTELFLEFPEFLSELEA
jgi:hypothetical protein